MPHDLLNTHYMDEQRTVDLQCMVWHNNNRIEEIYQSKRKKSLFQRLKLKNIVRAQTYFLCNNVSESLSLY